MTGARFSFSVVGGRTELAVQGEVDLDNVAELEAALADLVARADGHPLVVDVSELEFVDSSGVKALVRAQRRYEHGTRLQLRNPTPAVRRVLELMVPDMFDIG